MPDVAVVGFRGEELKQGNRSDIFSKKVKRTD